MHRIWQRGRWECGNAWTNRNSGRYERRSEALCFHPLHALLHGVAGQLTQGIGADPAGSRPVEALDLGCQIDGASVECRIALADLAQCPVDRFLDVVTFVARGGEDQRKTGDKAL